MKDSDLGLDTNQMNKQIMLTRDLTKADGLDQDRKEGERLYLYNGPTYGCISDSGIACSEIRGKHPFFEVPKDAFKLVEEIAKA